MARLTATKIGESKNAIKFVLDFWIAENRCGFNNWKPFRFVIWYPKKVVLILDESHIEIPKKFFDETLELIRDRHPFNRVKYVARYYPDWFKWTRGSVQEKS